MEECKGCTAERTGKGRKYHGGRRKEGSVGLGGGPSTGGEAMQGMGMMMQQQLMASQAEVMKSQARLNNVEADKKEGVDTELTKTEIGKMAAEIGNVQAQSALTKVNTAIQEVAKNIAEDTEA